MRNLYIVFISAALLFTGCGNSFRVFYDLDPKVDFSQYTTYSFLDWSEGNNKVITGMERERIRSAFASELEKRGLDYAEENADLKVQVTVYFREARRPVFGYYYPDFYNYMERALAVDIFEGATKQHIWHSVAIGEIGRTPEIRAEELPKQVEEMFESFPVQP